jgi:biopolymer transport protein ExbB
MTLLTIFCSWALEGGRWLWRIAGMIEQLKGLMVHSGASWVIWLLIALSVGCVAVVMERTRAFWKRRDDVDALVTELHRCLSDRDVDAARRRLVTSPSAAAKVALAGLAQWDSGARAAEEAMAAATGLERARMQRRLLFLGTVGNNAPFVGLLGTVIGVVGAFDELGKSEVAAAATNLAPERVMSTIAEALVATAIGLVVAIPAVALFNYFQGLLAASLASAETLGHVVLTHIERDNGN